MDAQQSYDLSSPDDEEHRQEVENRKQEKRDEKLDELENN